MDVNEGAAAIGLKGRTQAQRLPPILPAVTKEGVIFFDLTQLVLRARDPTPDGIGRVELAYARHLLDRYRRSVRFLFAMQRLVYVIPTKVAERYIESITQYWKQEDIASNTLLSELHSFLGSDDLLADQRALILKRKTTRRRLKASIVADLLTNSAFQSLKPKNLGRFSNSIARNAYICVSNSTYTSKWLVNWLARSPSVSSIWLLHDIIPLSNPEYVVPATTGRHRRHVRRLATTAHTIITNSKFTQESFERYSDLEGLPKPYIVTSLLGVDDDFTECNSDRFKTEPYFVFVSTIEPRKNHLMLLHVWQRLIEIVEDPPKLLLIGRRGWENENILDVIERSDVLKGFVKECSNVPDQLLIKLIANARAALFPSHVEGYGLPLAEALTIGAPVICSDIPPFKEIGGDIPEYVDPLAGRGWLKLIKEYTPNDSARRASQMERLRNFVAPRWPDHLAKLDAILEGADSWEDCSITSSPRYQTA